MASPQMLIGLCTALMGLAGCSDALTVNLANIEDFGKPYEPVATEEDTPDPEPIPTQAAIPEPVVNERDLPCNEFEGEFRVWHCEDGWRMYP